MFLSSVARRHNSANMNTVFQKVGKKNFGILSEYNDRKNKKLVGGGHFLEEPKFWVTSSFWRSLRHKNQSR